MACNTLMTYVGNIAKAPGEEKYRKIRLSNAAFHQRVGGLQGGLRFLRAMGFEQAPPREPPTPPQAPHMTPFRCPLLCPPFGDHLCGGIGRSAEYSPVAHLVGCGWGVLGASGIQGGARLPQHGGGGDQQRTHQPFLRRALSPVTPRKTPPDERSVQERPPRSRRVAGIENQGRAALAVSSSQR